MNISERISCFHIVDDDDSARYLLKRSCKRLLGDLTVHEYASAEHFIEFFDSIMDADLPTPKIENSLITMDLRMPGMGGLKALQHMQNKFTEGYLSDVPFCCLVLTSSSNKQDMKEVEEYSFVQRYVEKPLTVELLAEITQAQQHARGST